MRSRHLRHRDLECDKLARLTDVSQPCCIERIPGSEGLPTRVLVSNLGDGTLQLVEVVKDGTMKSLGKAKVAKAPKRVAFVPPPAQRQAHLYRWAGRGKSFPELLSP